MTVDLPRFDTLTPEALVRLAQDRLKTRDGPWQALDPADPGLGLIEAFATVTAEEITRLNALPERLQGLFLSMLGARLRPPTAQLVRLRFERVGATRNPTEIPSGQQVSVAGEPETVFVLMAPVTIPAGETAAEGMAARVDQVPMQIVGRGTGLPNQVIQLLHGNLAGAPAAAAQIEILVDWSGHPAPPGFDPTSFDGMPCIRFVETDRLNAETDTPHFVADRVAGRIRMPAAGPCLPPPGAAILAGYCHVPNVPLDDLPDCGSLRDMVPPLPGISVTNPAAAKAARPAETATERLARGPLAMLAGDLAFRARDYEALALDAHPAVMRAHALTPAARWDFAKPGTVRVLVAPHTPAAADGTIRAEAYHAARSGAEGDARGTLQAIRTRLSEAAPLGVSLEIDWLPALAVGIDLTAFVTPGTDHGEIEGLLYARLGAFLSPVASDEWPGGWPLGRTLRKSQLLEHLLSLPDIRAIDDLVLRPSDPMIGKVQGIAADCAQRGVWFTAVGGVLYRTLDNGDGWTRAPLPDETDADPVATVAVHPLRSGLVAAVTKGGSILASRDCGQSFAAFADGPEGVSALLWVDGGETPRLLIAGVHDLCESSGPPPEGGPGRARSLVAADGALVGPAHALAAVPDGRGGRIVAVARRALGGVVISYDSGWDGSFRPIGLEGEDIRALCFLTQENALWLIAGLAAPMVAGQSAVRMARLDPDMAVEPAWTDASDGWPGGSLRSLVTDGTGHLYAATETDGLVVGTLVGDGLRWVTPPPDSGLPTAKSGMVGLSTLAARTASERQPAGLMVGGDGHLLFSDDGAKTFTAVAQTAGTDRITLPQDWVICSADHVIEVCDVTD